MNTCNRCENEIPEGKRHIPYQKLGTDGKWMINIDECCIEIFICKCECHPLCIYCPSCLGMSNHPERINEIREQMNQRIEEITARETHTSKLAELA